MEWRLISAAPRIKLLKEEGRSSVLDADTLAKLLEATKQPLRDVALIVFDSGMRPSEVFQMRWEDLDWDKRMIFVPRGKTKLSHRHLPMSDRVAEALLARHEVQTAPWAFPSDSKSGHLATVAKYIQVARRKAGLPKSIVLYTGRHTFGTSVLASTGNLSLVMRAMGHSSLATAMRYHIRTWSWFALP